MPDLWAFRADVTNYGADLSGLAVQAADGGMGKVKEVVDRDSRTFVVIDTGPWIFGKKIKVPAGLVSGIDLDEGVVAVDRSRRQLGSAPRQSGDLAADEAHEDALTRYYRSEEADTPTAARPEPPTPESTAPSDPAADAKPRAEKPASRIDEGQGIDPDAPNRDRDGDRTETRSDSTGGEPPSTPERAGGAEAAPTPTGGAEDTPGRDRPRRRRRKPAGAADNADASPRPSAITPAKAGRDAATSPAAKGTDAPREERSSKAPARASRRGEATSGERPRTRTAPASGRTRANAPRTTKAKAATPDRTSAETPARSEPARRTAKRTEQRPKTSSNGQPLARYDALTAAEVVARLRSLTQSELAQVERYEQRGEKRQTILKRVAALREKEPWRGYDSANVSEVKEKLAKAKADRVTAVRDYERRHRERAGVMDAVRRRLEDL